MTVKCPKCEAEIDHLDAFCKETNKYEVFLENPPYTGLDWGRAEPTESSATETEFCCPVCGGTLWTFEGENANNWAIVEEFLKGKLRT